MKLLRVLIFDQTSRVPGEMLVVRRGVELTNDQNPMRQDMGEVLRGEAPTQV